MIIICTLVNAKLSEILKYDLSTGEVLVLGVLCAVLAATEAVPIRELSITVLALPYFEVRRHQYAIIEDLIKFLEVNNEV